MSLLFKLIDTQQAEFFADQARHVDLSFARLAAAPLAESGEK